MGHYICYASPLPAPSIALEESAQPLYIAARSLDIGFPRCGFPRSGKSKDECASKRYRCVAHAVRIMLRYYTGCHVVCTIPISLPAGAVQELPSAERRPVFVSFGSRSALHSRVKVAYSCSTPSCRNVLRRRKGLQKMITCIYRQFPTTPGNYFFFANPDKQSLPRALRSCLVVDMHHAPLRYDNQ